MLQAEARTRPQPVRRWLVALAMSGNAQRSGGAKQAAAAAFNAPGGPASLCQQAVTGRYPFTAGRRTAFRWTISASLFAPSGMINQFFNTQLRPFVDTSGATWKAQAVAGVAPPVTPGDLAQFQRAAAIGELFFAGGGAQPSVRFDITPQTLDRGAKQVTLELGGQVDQLRPWAAGRRSVTWPGPTGMNRARLVFDPPPSGGPPRAAGERARGRCSGCSIRGRCSRRGRPSATR